MTLRRPLLLLAFATAAGFAACTLNPQPLPPVDTQATANDAGRSGADGSAFGTPPPQSASDAAGGSADSDGGKVGDGGDGGDAGDGSADAADGDGG